MTVDEGDRTIKTALLRSCGNVFSEIAADIAERDAPSY